MTAKTALRLKSDGRRMLLPVTGVVLVGGAFIGAPRGTSFADRAAVTTLLSRPSSSRNAAHQTLPFTIADFVRYFSTALETNASASGDRFVFTGSANGHAEDVFRIVISAEGRELVVAFRGGGDYGITLAREFFEASFFNRDETLRFFTLLDESRDGAVTTNLRRFTVHFTHIAHGDDFHLTLRFTPAAS